VAFGIEELDKIPLNIYKFRDIWLSETCTLIAEIQSYCSYFIQFC